LTSVRTDEAKEDENWSNANPTVERDDLLQAKKEKKAKLAPGGRVSEPAQKV